MPYKDLGEHTGTLVGLLSTIAGLLVLLLWRFHAAVTNAIDTRINVLHEAIKELSGRLDRYQPHQKERPLPYFAKEDITNMQQEFRLIWEEIRKDRCESWARQELVNSELLKLLNTHTHDGRTGKVVGSDNR